MRRAFESVEAEWLGYYRANIVTGDAPDSPDEASWFKWHEMSQRTVSPPSASRGGRAGEREMVVRIKNTGKRVDRRVQGSLDLAALE